MSEPTDRELLDRAVEGDHAAFGVLFDRHVSAVYWQAYAVLRQAQDAQDVTQDVFVTTWRKRADIVMADSLAPWLIVTARNTALNLYRKRSRLRSVPLDADPGHTHVETEVAAAEVRRQIDAAVATLPLLDRELFDRCIDGDDSYADAAAALGISHGAVRNRLSRLRSRMRDDLAGLKEDS